MADVATTQASGGGLAVKRSILRVIIFYLLSPLYAFYWFYQTRAVVTKQVNGQDQVGLQTLGLIVPILNLFIYYWLLRDVDKFNRAAGGQGLPVPPLWMILIPVIMAVIPIVNFFAGIVAIIFFVIVLMRLNEGLDKKGATEAPYTTGEIAVVLAGVVLWVLYFAVFAALLTSGADVNTIDVNSTYSY